MENLETDRLLEIIKKFGAAKVLVVGDIMVDHFIYGSVSRISPEAPVPVVNVRRENLLPGGAANVMHNVSKLGARVYAAGVVGGDYNGGVLKQLLSGGKGGVDISGILTLDNFQTIIKTRVIAHNQQIVRFDRESNGRFGSAVYAALLKKISEIADEVDAAIISDYGKGLIERKFFTALVNTLRGKNKFVALDPKVENFKFYRNVSVLTPNLNETAGGSGIKIKDEKSLEKAGRAIIRKVKPDYLLVTKGEAGMSLFDGTAAASARSGPAAAPLNFKARAKEVFDVTGAGDTVISTLTVAKSVGADISEACYIANAAASIAVSQLGTYAVGAGEIASLISADCEPAKA